MTASPPTRRKRIDRRANGFASSSIAMTLCFSLLLPAKAALATPSREPVAAPPTSEKAKKEAAYRKILANDAKKAAAKGRWRKGLTWVGIGGVISGLAIGTFRKQFYDHDRALEIQEILHSPTSNGVDFPDIWALEQEYEGLEAREARVIVVATGTIIASLGVLLYRFILF